MVAGGHGDQPMMIGYELLPMMEEPIAIAVMVAIVRPAVVVVFVVEIEMVLVMGTVGVAAWLRWSCWLGRSTIRLQR